MPYTLICNVNSSLALFSTNYGGNSQISSFVSAGNLFLTLILVAYTAAVPHQPLLYFRPHLTKPFQASLTFRRQRAVWNQRSHGRSHPSSSRLICAEPATGFSHRSFMVHRCVVWRMWSALWPKAVVVRGRGFIGAWHHKLAASTCGDSSTSNQGQ